MNESRKKANQRYLKENVDHINLRVPKGEKDGIKIHASMMGESVNKFIIRSIRETMERDIETTSQNAPESILEE